MTTPIRTVGLTAVISILGAATIPARAQLPPRDAAEVPVQRTQRELVLPEGYVRVDLALTLGDDGHPDGNLFFAHDLGGGFSPVLNLELGVSLNREWFWPRVGGGVLPLYWNGDDVHFRRIPIYARYQFVTTDNVAIAVDLEANLQTHPGRKRHSFRASLPVRLRAGSFMFDTGATTELETNDAQANFYFPAVFTFNATDLLHFRVATGAGIRDADRRGAFMPLFFGGGYVATVADTRVDINVDFGFPRLVHHDNGSGDNTSPDLWMVKTGVAVYFDVF